MPTLRSALDAAVSRLEKLAGIRLSRGAVNRFAALDDTLDHLWSLGYRPRVIIDGGANVAAWARMAHRRFPEAALFLLEPQPGCEPALRDFQREVSAAQVDLIALAQPGIERVELVGADEKSTQTGAWVSHDPQSRGGGLAVPATTLDALFAARFDRSDRIFLKLDLEGQELNALKGAARLLRAVEVVLAEVRFFDVNHAGAPVFADVLEYLRSEQFELYDFASLSARARDGRLHLGDAIFVRQDSAIRQDVRWQ